MTNWQIYWVNVNVIWALYSSQGINNIALQNVSSEVVVVVVKMEGAFMWEEKDRCAWNKTQTEPFTQVHASP